LNRRNLRVLPDGRGGTEVQISVFPPRRRK
jgi:hypothetical protein